MWTNASPKWKFDDATYDRTAHAFTNADHVAIVIHNYRWRLSLAAGEAQYDALEQRLFARRSSPCPPSPSPATSTVPPPTACHTETSSPAITPIAS
jgi:hypothetical protein